MQDPSINPLRNITKIDEYSRTMVLHRLCRFVQDNYSALPLVTRIGYAVFMEQMSTRGTNLRSPAMLDALANLTMGSSTQLVLQDSSSAISLVTLELEASTLKEAVAESPTSEDQQDLGWLIDAFLECEDRRFTPCQALFLLWADCLTALAFQFPAFAKIIKKQLLRRARYEMLPLAVLALT